MDLHLDPIGGLAGDMFVAALLDFRPDLEPGVADALAKVALLSGVSATLLRHEDGALVGKRFRVERDDRGDRGGPLSNPDRASSGHHAPHETPGHDQTHGAHAHVAWRDIRAALTASSLGGRTIRHAIGIFTALAEAEARVHGVEPDDVAFHEVGAWDSIADIVAAAFLIDALDIQNCTVGPIPLGSGRVNTAHGVLPIPAPATALLLEGFAIVDDGIPGERVTPTGAAILRHLCAGGERPSGPRRLRASGFGFGTRTLPGIANCVRALLFEPLGPSHAEEQVAILEFEIDDQTAEDLAQGLERLRAAPGVLDIVQMAVLGKKNRMMTQVRILAEPEALPGVTALIFEETTTIGLRQTLANRVVLPRDTQAIEVDGNSVRVKTVQRPGGSTAKAEADDIARAGGRAARDRLRRKAERGEA